MQIICPECKFSREVDASKIPARSQVATCPKCQTKFKFRDLPEDDFAIEEPTPAPEPAPEPKAEPAPEPVLKPFTQDEPVMPEAQEEPEPAPVQEPEQPAFNNVPKPDADDKGGLWDRLDSMAPPEAPEEQDDKQDAAPQAAAKAERKPPVIGAKYGQPEDAIPGQDTTPEPPQDQQPVPGWTGEFSDDFPDPMDHEDEEEPQEDEHSMQVPPPFEQLDRYGFFSGLFTTIKLVLLSPRLFFSVMPVGNGVSKPLTFAILVAMFQALAQLGWGAIGLTVGIAPSANGITPVPYDLTSGMFELLLTPAIAAISLYIISGFYHLILKVLQGSSQGFEGTFRALAYGYAPMITGIIPMPSMEITMGWMLIYAVWSLALTAIALKHVHKTSYFKVVPALLLPILVGMVLIGLSMQGQLPTI